MNTYIVTMNNGKNPSMKITITAQNINEARRQAESMHKGWKISSVIKK